MWHQFTVLRVLCKECKTRRDHLGYQIQSPHDYKRQRELLHKVPQSIFFFHVPLLTKHKDTELPRA